MSARIVRIKTLVNTESIFIYYSITISILTIQFDEQKSNQACYMFLSTLFALLTYALPC